MILGDDLDTNGRAITGKDIRLQVNRGGKFIFEEGSTVLGEYTGAELISTLTGGGGGGGGGGASGPNSAFFNLVATPDVVDDGMEFLVMVAPVALTIKKIIILTHEVFEDGWTTVDFRKNTEGIFTNVADTAVNVHNHGRGIDDSLSLSMAIGDGLWALTNIPEGSQGQSAANGLDVYIEWEI